MVVMGKGQLGTIKTFWESRNSMLLGSDSEDIFYTKKKRYKIFLGKRLRFLDPSHRGKFFW